MKRKTLLSFCLIHLLSVDLAISNGMHSSNRNTIGSSAVNSASSVKTAKPKSNEMPGGNSNQLGPENQHGINSDSSDYVTEITDPLASLNQSSPNFFPKPCPACEIESYILRNATKAHPPQNPDGSAVGVEGRLIVSQLLDMNVRDETLQVMCTVRIMWTDTYMVWDSSDYGGIVEIRLHPNKLWVPDLLLENSFGQSHVHQLDYQNYVVASYFGLLYWAIPMVVLSKCRTDVTYFPFDHQKCSIRMSSWTYHDKLINFTLSQYNSGMEIPVSNIEWTITEVLGTFYPNPMPAPHPYYPGEVISYPYIIYDIVMKRKPSFYVNLLVVPSFVISWLGAVIYLIPNASGEKLGFSITLFLSLYVNQVIVAEHLPPSADTFPLIARFYMLISFMLAISVFPTVFTLSFHYKLIQTLKPEESNCSAILNWFEKLGRCKNFWFVTCCCEVTCKCLAESNLMKKKDNDARLNIDENLQSFTLVNNHYKENCRYTTNNGNNRLYHAINNGIRNLNHAHASKTNTTNHHENNHIDDYNSVFDEERIEYKQSVIQDSSPTQINAQNRRDSVLGSTTEMMLERVLTKIDSVLNSEPDILLQRWQVIAAGVDKLGFFVYCMSLTLVTSVFSFFLIFRNYPA
ncbi:acetylcholine receptor subunit alpha-type acr-16-like isoform X2 [Symsagittifera roscoffensis]|uniref:acetylcholine receptor subunit alpha-type acr-16-like isoform X2 n=1 Tax=Symsagittifera roscoffensis TaxID=84072 RepID=UPI00307B8892